MRMYTQDRAKVLEKERDILSVGYYKGMSTKNMSREQLEEAFEFAVEEVIKARKREYKRMKGYF